MNRQYTRQEAIELAGVTSSKASYFDRIGLVVPQKIGESKKPYVFYSDEQISKKAQVTDPVLKQRGFSEEYV